MHADAPPPAEKSAFQSPVFIWSLGAIIALAIIVLFSYQLLDPFEKKTDTTAEQPQEIHDSITEQPQASVSAPSPEPVDEPHTADQPTRVEPPLPTLADSDESVRAAASTLTAADNWLKWITTDEAIRKFVVVTQNLSEGDIARKYLPISKPKERFKVLHNGDKMYLDPAGFKRYTSYVQTLNSIDNANAVSVYLRYLPLFEQAFAELGHKNRTFHSTLMNAFDVILNAPVIYTDIEVVRPSVYYKFADTKLEAHSAMHKQLIRMGPENTRAIQRKIRQLKTALSQ